MTSKNLFFKLMKKDLGQRLWAVALIGMGCFFAYPVTAAVSAGDIERYEDLKLGMIRYSDQILEWLSFENGMTAFVMMVAALVCGISGFAWLNAKSKVDFYHSIPVRREVLFHQRNFDYGSALCDFHGCGWLHCSGLRSGRHKAVAGDFCCLLTSSDVFYSDVYHGGCISDADGKYGGGLSGLRGVFFRSASGSQSDSGIFYDVFPHRDVGELAESHGNRDSVFSGL